MSEEFNAEEQKFILESKRWKNRRKIAYIAMFTGSIICLATTGIMSFGSVERVKALRVCSGSWAASSWRTSELLHTPT